MATLTWTDYRGRKWPVCSCLKAWLPVYQAELIRLGVIGKGLDLFQAIGNAPASAGYHSKGGNVDTAQTSTKAIEIARQMGGASWARGPADGMTVHAHTTLKGCPHMTYGPRWQVTELEAERNGLANRGRDRGPRAGIPFPLRSFKAGIKWAKARQKPKPAPKPMRTTEFSVLLHNMASDKGNWTKVRAPLIASRIKAVKPHFISAVELYDDRRTTLSRLITLTYKTVTHYYGKVQYAHRSVNGWQVVKVKTYPLGNGKHGVAVHYRHRKTGAEIVLVTIHLSFEHGAGKLRKGEIGKLMTFLKRDFDGLPLLVTGDLNDAHRPTSSRPNDTAGDALKAAGLHDLYFDVPNAKKVNKEYNTANGFKVPPTTDQIHLDRFFGTDEFKGLAWTADVQPPNDSTTPYPADHWAIFMGLSVRHRSK